MLLWAFIFFILAIVAAAFGFGGIAAAVGAAQILFFLFLVPFVISLIVGFVAL